MAFNIISTQRVSCIGQYDRIDHLIPFSLRGDKCPVVRQFLVGEFDFSAVFECLYPLFVGHAGNSSGRGSCQVLHARVVWPASLIAVEVRGCYGNIVSQDRSLTNAGVRASVSYVKGIHNVKAGAVYEQTFKSWKASQLVEAVERFNI